VLFQVTDSGQYVGFQPLLDEPFEHFNARPLANEHLHSAQGANHIRFLLLARSHVERPNAYGAWEPSCVLINHRILPILVYYGLDAATR
jgi:hypothetical protein